MKKIDKLIVSLLKELDLGSAIAVRLTKITGKSKQPIHPKHFLTEKPWFTTYLKKNDRVVDVGCGNGQNSQKAARFVKEVIGIDYDPKLLHIAQKSAKLKRIKNIHFAVANLEKKLEFKKNSFSAVLFFDVLEHLHKRDQILEEITRILKPNGYLFLSVPNKSTSWKIFQEKSGVCSFSDPDHKIEFDERGIKLLLKKHGFHIVSLGYSRFDTPLRGLIDIIGGISLPMYKKLMDWREKVVEKNSKEASGFEIVAIYKGKKT